MINNPKKIFEFIECLFQEHPHVAIGENHSDKLLHRLVAESIPYLAETTRLTALCLEIPSNFQEIIDNYSKTGNDSFLKQLEKEHERLAESGYPFQGRLDSEYWNIIRNAFQNRLKVIAISPNLEGMPESEIDNEEIDKFMAEYIPQEPALIYAGEMHLRKDFAMPKFKRMFALSHLRNPLVHPKKHLYTMDLWLMDLYDRNPNFPKSFGIDLKKDELGKSLDQRLTSVGYTPYSNWFDGMVVY